MIGRTLPTAASFAVTICAAVAGASLVAADVKIPAANDPAAWVSRRVQLWQPGDHERRFDEIGWASNIVEARRLSKEHQRPVFLFTHDGHMAVGRC